MKRTAGSIVISPFLKRDALVDYIDNVSPMEEVIYKGLRNKTGHTRELLKITDFLIYSNRDATQAISESKTFLRIYSHPMVRIWRESHNCDKTWPKVKTCVY